MPACFNLGYRYIPKAIIEISFGINKKARGTSALPALLPLHYPSALSSSEAAPGTEVQEHPAAPSSGETTAICHLFSICPFLSLAESQRRPLLSEVG